MNRENVLLRKIKSASRSILKLPPPLVTESLLGREFTVRQGTIRDIPDKDDAWLLACACRSRRIFDIGANIGQSAMLELFPETVEHVLLVDPNPMALTIAAENLIVNHLVNRAGFECVFVSELPGKAVEFYTFLYGAAGSMFKTHAKTAGKHNLHFSVPTTTIDLLICKYGVPDFIKIDVEGAESFVLKGATNCMRQQRTLFLVEMHSSPEMPMVENAQQVLQICSENNYSAWYLSRKTLLTDSQQLRSRGRCHLLLQPKSWEWPQSIISIDENTRLEANLIQHLQDQLP